MQHPYERYENTPLWLALDAEISELEQNQDLTLSTARRYVIGALCQRLDRSNLVSSAAVRSEAETRAAFAAFLDRAARATADALEWQHFAATHYPDETLEAVRREAILLQMRHQQGGIGAEALTSALRDLAGRLRDRAV